MIKKEIKYKHLFFDLDQTLWDFEANARATFHDLFRHYELNNRISDFNAFFKAFLICNERLWDKYRKGKITKNRLRTERFRMAFKDFGIQDTQFITAVSDFYMEEVSKKPILIEGTIEVLDNLTDRYSMHILTNGFPEIQKAKIQNSGLTGYFGKIITSYDAGYQKPDGRIFEYALKSVNAGKFTSIMIGDDLKVDILGAKKCGLDQVYFNKERKTHNEQVTFEINELQELLTILM